MSDRKPYFPTVRLLLPPVPAERPRGMVYSTNPRFALATDGNHYFVKGPDSKVVVAECVGYALARAVGLPTPDPAFTRDPVTNEPLFGCRELRVRGVDLVERYILYSNASFWADLIAFDTWIANPDRNLSNVLAEPDGGPGGETVSLYAIDFEKSRVLRGDSPIRLNAAAPGEWWPKEQLATLLPSTLPLPKAMIGRIKEVGLKEVRAIVLALVMDSVAIGNFEDLVYHLESRAKRIEELVKECWNARSR